MLAATNFFRVDDLLVQIYNSEVEMAEKVAEIAQNYLQQVLQQQETAAGTVSHRKFPTQIS